MAGNFDADAICRQFEDSLSCMTATKAEKETVPSVYVPSFKTKVKEIEQSHICLGTRALPFGHEDVYALTILNNIMGGSMSSRLFQHIREEKGMAYTVYSYTSAYNRNGLYASAPEWHTTKWSDGACDSRGAGKAGCRRRYGRRTENFQRTDKKAAIFSASKIPKQNGINGKYALNRNSVRTPEEVIRAVDAVDQDDIRRVAQLITNVDSYSGTLVSKRDLDLEKLIKA